MKKKDKTNHVLFIYPCVLLLYSLPPIQQTFLGGRLFNGVTDNLIQTENVTEKWRGQTGCINMNSVMHLKLSHRNETLLNILSLALLHYIQQQ